MQREILRVRATRRDGTNGDVTQGQTKTSATCATGGARRHFSTGRIAKWQPAGLLYVQEIYRLRPFRRAKGRPRSLWQQTGGSQHLPFYFPGCEPSASPSLALFASSDSVAPSCSLPPRRSSFFFTPRIFLSPLCFFAVVARRRLFVRSSEPQPSSRAAALGDPVCRGSFRRRWNFLPTKERTLYSYMRYRHHRSTGFGQYVSGKRIVACMKVRKHKFDTNGNTIFCAFISYG